MPKPKTTRQKPVKSIVDDHIEADEIEIPPEVVPLGNWGAKKVKKKSLSKLKGEADRVFSLWIRKSHADAFGNIRCVTCGNRHPLKNMQAGHFVSRVHLSTRYDELNVHPQCVSCNIFKQGNGAEFARYLIQQYGHNIIDELLRKKHETLKITRAGYLDLIETYTQKIKALG